MSLGTYIYTVLCPTSKRNVVVFNYNLVPRACEGSLGYVGSCQMTLEQLIPQATGLWKKCSKTTSSSRLVFYAQGPYHAMHVPYPNSNDLNLIS